MKCIELSKISELLDGELDGDDTARLDAHMEACLECKAEVEKLLSLSTMVQKAGPVIAPSSLDARVMSAFRANHGPVSFFERLRGMRMSIPLPVFAASLLFAVGGLWAAFAVGSMSSKTVFVHSEPDLVSDRVERTEAPQTAVEPAIFRPQTQTRVITRVVNVCSAKENKPDRMPDLFISPKPTLPALTATASKDGYFTDLKLDGFRPPETLNAQIIKGVKKDER